MALKTGNSWLSVQLTVEEVCRGKKRKEFLSQITLAGQTSGLQFVEALEVAVTVIQKVHQLEVAGGRAMEERFLTSSGCSGVWRWEGVLCLTGPVRDLPTLPEVPGHLAQLQGPCCRTATTQVTQTGLLPC